MRVCTEKTTGKLIESQSGGDTQDHLKTLIDNAVRAGYDIDDIEARFVDEDEFRGMIAALPPTEQQLILMQKEMEIESNIPTWDIVESSIENIGSLADAKVFLKRLSRVVYWLAKNSGE